MLNINRLPINAGMIKFTSHMANDAAKIPIVLALNNSNTCMLVSHRRPNSVRNVKVGMIAITRNTTLTPPHSSPALSNTPNTGNIRPYCTMNTRYLPKDKNKIFNKSVASKFCKTFIYAWYFASLDILPYFLSRHKA